MKSALVALTTLATAGLALAQPPVQPYPPAGSDVTVEPAPAPPAEPPPEPAPAPVVAPAPAPPPPDPAPVDAYRPSAFSIGIGLGYRVRPLMSFQSPDVTSVRFRLPTGLTFEPRVVLANQKDEIDLGTDTTTRTSEVGLGTVVRFPWMKRGRADLELLGSIDVNISNVNPEGDDNSRRQTTLAVGYGVAVNVWLWQHLNVSMTAGNSLFIYDKTRTENGIPDDVTSESTRTFALIFDPTVLFMAHLYL